MPFNSSKPYTFDRVVRIGLTILVILALISVLRYLSSVLVPFAVAWLLAYFINPLVNFLQHKARLKHRILAVLTSLVLVIGALVGLFLLVVPVLGREFSDMGGLLTNYLNNSTLATQASSYLPENFNTFIEKLSKDEEVRDLLNAENLGQLANILGAKVLPGIWGIFSGSLNFLIGIIGLSIILLYLVFILLDYETFIKRWQRLIPPSYRATVTTVIDDVSTAMNRYFRAQAFVASIVGILFAVGFSLISLPMGFALGLFFGLLNMVPYLQLIGFLPASLLALMHSLETGQNFWTMMLLVLLVFIVVQIIQDAILVPKIMGDVTGLNSAVILLSLSVWGKLLGILGLIIALPISSVLVSYYNRFLSIAESEEQQGSIANIVQNKEAEVEKEKKEMPLQNQTPDPQKNIKKAAEDTLPPEA